ncbi:MAG TPA: protein-L-isoaspartate O-methyltransferase [Alphaproteobacteria bacterium]|nr:protein-L-isoaspartate O-methyltransferase [Alphaproteobacteria bacterium]HAM48506.1 protein-L-isoaspartate O-methyltransferase [Alphaproteobacteria bacterium]HBA43311.1 protein-L-isoaspartate O-methyltransferase [Alphaproteobacteria bacterium]HBC54471.1 protein-L-isoaspartate O-methyltransferase [Alphaproteobacteria bacterium]HCO91202.1 protein-L-isoaspartate O-methyltransferase [Alphaproteobacteria bacterium]
MVRAGQFVANGLLGRYKHTSFPLCLHLYREAKQADFVNQSIPKALHMSDPVTARRIMVESQIRPRNITDPRILASLRKIPREAFVPKAKKAVAYSEGNIEVAAGRYLLDPGTLCTMIDGAEIGPQDIVLIIGGGDGYAAALIGQLANAVLALESDSELAEKAASLLEGLDADNVALVNGELAAGYPDEAPYDVILVNGGAELSLQELASQLRDGGRLVGIEYEQNIGRVRLYRKDGGIVSGRTLEDADAPVLPGFVKPRQFSFDAA